MSTGTVRTLAGRKRSRGTLAAIVILSTNVALGRELEESGMMAELLAVKALGSRVLGLQIFHEDAKMQEAREGTERRLEIQMMSQHTKRHEVSGANARSVNDRSPHLANGRDDKALSRKFIHYVI